jgi:putative tricarboxylic transport membrane protein
MKLERRLLALVLLGFAATGWTQGWSPQRPVELVVGFAPGGGNDRTARTLERILVANKLVPTSVNVVNKPGGSTSIAYTYVSQRPGDAHALMVFGQTLLTNHITAASPLNYSDFTPIASLFSEYHVYVVSVASQLRTGKELVDRLKGDVKSVTTGVSAIGSPGHISVSLLNKLIGGNARDLKIVAFKGSAEALTSVLGGHIELTPAPASVALPPSASGQVRLVAVAAPRRLPGALAAVPTWREQGVDLVYGPWRAILGPKGLSTAQIAFWENALKKATETADWKSDLEKNLGIDDFATGARFRKDLDKDYADTRAVLVELGMAKQ